MLTPRPTLIRRWTIAIAATAALWAAYFVYLGFTELGDDKSLPMRIEATARALLIAATMLMAMWGVALWAYKRVVAELSVIADGIEARSRASMSETRDGLSTYLGDAAEAYELGRKAGRAERDKQDPRPD